MQACYGETETVLAAVKRDPRLATRANERGDRLLDYSCMEGHLELARGLLVLGAQINARDSNGWDALMATSRHGHLAVVGLLLSKGADPNSRNARDTALSLRQLNSTTSRPAFSWYLTLQTCWRSFAMDRPLLICMVLATAISPPRSRSSAALSFARHTTRARTRTHVGSAAGRLCVCWCVATSSRWQLARRTCS